MRLDVFLTPGKSCPFSNFSAIRSKQPELLPVWIPTIKNVNRTTILICNSSSSCFLRQEIQDQLSKWPSNGSLAFTIFGEQRFYQRVGEFLTSRTQFTNPFAKSIVNLVWIWSGKYFRARLKKFRCAVRQKSISQCSPYKFCNVNLFFNSHYFSLRK